MEYVLTGSKLNFGLSITEIRVMTFEFRKREKIKEEVLEKWKGMATLDWYYSFMKLHPRIALRTPKQFSIQRVKAFNKEDVTSKSLD